MKKLIAVLLLLLPVSFGLELNFTTYPEVVLPGDTLKVHFTARGYAVNLKYKLVSPYETDWREVGDISGFGSFVVFVNVPDVSPGLRFAEVVLRFFEGNEYRETTVYVPYWVLQKPIEVELTGKVSPGVLSSLLLRVRTGMPLRDVRVILVPSLDETREVQYLEGVGEFSFRVLPECRSGVQEFNVVVEGVSDRRVSTSRRFVLICVPNEELRVESNLPPEIDPGTLGVSVVFENPTDVPATVGFKVTSNVPLGGKTQGTVTIDGRSRRDVPVVLSVDDEVDTVYLTVSVFGEVNGVFSFSSHVRKEPKLVVYIKEVRPGTATVEVSNVGTADAKNLLLSTETSSFFIGTLTPGDYDSVDVPVEGNTLRIRLDYLYRGEKRTEEFTVAVNVPEEGAEIPLWVVLLLPLLYLAWRKLHARPSGDGS